ncbi:MAG: LytR/AlgR family response regulator transcription factor [Gammaproteobacteria bacterium]
MIRALLLYPDNACRGEVVDSLAQEPGLAIVADCVYVDDAIEKIESLRPDVVFVGMEAAPGGLTALDWPGFAKHPYVVVISDSERHAMEAFTINAVDYLLTPLDRARLKATLHRLHRSIEADQRLDRRLDLDTLVEYLREYVGKPQPKQQDERVSINFGGRFRFLSVKNIRYIEADRDYVDIHMLTGEVLHSTSRISEMFSKLPADRFLRIRRSTIVNIEHVREARAHKENYEIVMDNDVAFRPGTTYKSKVRAALVKGVGGKQGSRPGPPESPP